MTAPCGSYQRTALRFSTKAVFGAIAAVLAFAVSAPAMSDDLVQETQYLRVSIGGKTVRLEAMIVKRAGAQGRLPIAFINHGRPDTPAMALDESLTINDPGINTMADMARRGWLAVAIHRRGYGLSDGPPQSDSPCALDTFISWMNADADDVEAAIAVITKRPDADPARMITMGISAGGGTSLALGARNPPGLAAVINIAGGEHLSGCALISQSIPTDFKDLGSRSRLPSLWIFAKNDLNHPPDQVEVMRASFGGAGADLKLVMLDPIGEDGHAAMGTFAGRTKWLVEVDAFLRAHGLPTWPTSNVDVVLQKMHWTANSRAFVVAYLSAPSEKAMAWTSDKHNASYREAVTLDDARKFALDTCQQKGQQCTIAMENDRWVAGP